MLVIGLQIVAIAEFLFLVGLVGLMTYQSVMEFYGDVKEYLEDKKKDDIDKLPPKTKPLLLRSAALMPRGEGCEGHLGGMSTVAIPTQIYQIDHM
jgi:hypothetical protein